MQPYLPIFLPLGRELYAAIVKYQVDYP
jgi:hypothetical protein